MSGPQMTKALGVGAQSLQKYNASQQSISITNSTGVKTLALVARALQLIDKQQAEFSFVHRVLNGGVA